MSLELEQGLGRVTWWGFSPWTCLPGRSALLVGAGDPRHLVRSLAEPGQELEPREFFLLEQNIQVYCRQVSVVKMTVLLIILSGVIGVLTRNCVTVTSTVTESINSQFIS